MQEDKNPFETFDNQSEQHISDSYDLIPQEQDKHQHEESREANQKQIKKRKIIHKDNFGRGANHPSFFIRQFLQTIQEDRYKKIYHKNERNGKFYENLVKKGVQLKENKKRFNLMDLSGFFGQSENQDKDKGNHLNAKVFYKAISEDGLDMIMQISKCHQVLNHLISLEKYSSRLGNSKLTGRVEFQ